MSWLPHITVATVVDHQGRLLFVEEMIDGNAVLNQPAGHVEKNETLIQAAKRETIEESACEVEITNILGIYTQYLDDKDITYYRVCFLAKLLKEHKNQALDSEIIQTLWMEPEHALKKRDEFRSPFVASCIEDYLNGKRFPLDLITEL